MRLITFGCSLTEQGSKSVNKKELQNKKIGLVPNIVKGLEEKYNTTIEYLNYANSSASNSYIVERFNNYMITEHKSSDIIYWQVTSITRNSASFRINKNNNDWPYEKNDYDKYDNDYTLTRDDAWLPTLNTKNENVHFLSNFTHSLIKFCPETYGLSTNYNTIVSNLLAGILLAKRSGNPLVVCFGWDKVLTAADGIDHMKVFKKILLRNNVRFIFESYLEWCIKHDLPLNDDMHPTINIAAPEFAKKIVVPELINELL